MSTPSVVKQGDFFCSQISKKLIKPLHNKTLLLYLYCKTKPHTTMIDIIELVRISRAINTGRIPSLGAVAAVISPKGANAASAVIEAFRNRYRNSRMSVQEVIRLSNWSGLPVAIFTAAYIDVNLNFELTKHHNDDNQDIFTAADIDVNLEVELTNHHNDDNQDTTRS